jgi:hypothetical protein
MSGALDRRGGRADEHAAEDEDEGADERARPHPYLITASVLASKK